MEFHSDDEGSYEVQLTVTDIDGDSQTAVRTIVVGGVAPNATFQISTDQIVYEGSSGIALQFLNSNDPSSPDQNAGYTYSYDLNDDGLWDVENVSNASQAVSFPNDGVYRYRGRITDKDGLSREYSVTVNVLNQLPEVIEFRAGENPREGTPVLFSGRLFDPGSEILTAFLRIRRASFFGESSSKCRSSLPPTIHLRQHILSRATSVTVTT